MRKRYADILNQLESKVRSSSTLNDHVLLVDGLNNFIRAWSASPATNSDGDHIGGMLGFLQSVGLAIRTIRPTRKNVNHLKDRIDFKVWIMKTINRV
jgi:hypothetical protein